jgi:ribosomal protein S6
MKTLEELKDSSVIIKNDNFSYDRDGKMDLDIEGNEGSERIEKLFIEDEIRSLLKTAPNKNALYKALGLNVTYLNLKNFLNNKEKHLRQKSLDAILNYTGGMLVPFFIIPEDLTEEQLDVLYTIQDNFLEKLSTVHEKSKDFESRKTTPKITKNDINDAQSIIDNIMSEEVETNEDEFNDFFGSKNDLIRSDVDQEENTESKLEDSKEDSKEIDKSAEKEILNDFFESNDDEDIDIDIML